MAEEVDWPALQSIVLVYLKAKYSKYSEAARNLPNYMFHDPETGETTPMSPNDMMREVARLTDDGKKIILAEASKLKRLQPENQ